MNCWTPFLKTFVVVAGWHGTRLCGCPLRLPRAERSSLMPRRRVPCQPAFASAAVNERFDSRVDKHSPTRLGQAFCAGQGGARRAGDTEQNACPNLVGAHTHHVPLGCLKSGLARLHVKIQDQIPINPISKISIQLESDPH